MNLNLKKLIVCAIGLVFLIIDPISYAQELEISLKQLKNQTYEVKGQFWVETSSHVVWDVLCDYENIPSFVTSMRKSQIREKKPNASLVLYQEAVGGMFLVSKTIHVLLEVRQGEDQIDFEDIGRKDFWNYFGHWKTTSDHNGTWVEYQLTAQPDFLAPSFLMRKLVKNGARELLDQVRQEILRRKNAEIKSK